MNTCDPSCAEGHFETFKARLKLFKRTTCETGRKHQFLRVRLIFPGKRPDGAPKRQTYQRVCGTR